MSPWRLSSTSPRFSVIALSRQSAKLNHRSNPSLSGNNSGKTNESSAQSSPSELDSGVPVTMSRACAETQSRQRLSTHLSFLRRCPSSTTMYFHWKRHWNVKIYWGKREKSDIECRYIMTGKETTVVNDHLKRCDDDMRRVLGERFSQRTTLILWTVIFKCREWRTPSAPKPWEKF